jgi:CRISPR-associated protein Csm4
MSPLHSDTLFGAFCWSYKYLHGEEELLKFCRMYRDGNPPIIFSNGFAEGLLPMPLINIPTNIKKDVEKNKEEKLKIYTKRKIAKKLEWLKLENFNIFISGKKSMTKVNKQIESTVSYGNQINRLTDTVNDDGEGGLFTRNEYYTKGNMDIYLKIDSQWVDRFLESAELMISLGIGADKSVGKGIFTTVSFGKFDDFNIPDNPNAFVTLSNYIPSANDPTNGNYKTFVKYGKLDREFARSEAPFKKPLLMISEGAIFYTDKVKEYYGRVVTNAAVYNENIIQNGYVFVLPMVL